MTIPVEVGGWVLAGNEGAIVHDVTDEFVNGTIPRGKVWMSSGAPCRESALLPFNEIGNQRRCEAVRHVLQRLPDPDLNFLKEHSFNWYTPAALGQVCEPMQRTQIYLSPELEKLPMAVVVAVVAHELAHVRLDHKGQSWAYECEVWLQVGKWGFTAEIGEWVRTQATDPAGYAEALIEYFKG